MTDVSTDGGALVRESATGVWSNLERLGPALVLLSALLLGFGLRVYRLGQQNIWWDEGHAIWAARQSLARVTDITAHDVHPPLYLWMLHVWMRLTGDSEFSVRYLSTVGGMLTVALTYVVARRLVGRRAALLATLLVAIARFHIWWSQEARMYIWATCFVLLSVYFMIRLRHGGPLVWWLYILISAAALYTLYLSVLALLVQNVFIALTVWHKPRRRRFLFNWGLAQLGILVLYAPWLAIALDRIRTDTARTSFTLGLVWQLYGTVLVTGISTHLDWYAWLLLLFALLAAAGLVLLCLDRRQPQRYGFAGWEVGLLLFLPLIVPPLVVYGLSIPRGIYYSPKPEARYLLVFAPPFYILLAGALVSLWPRRREGRALAGGTVAVAALVLVLGTFVGVLPGHYAGRYLRDEYQSAMLTLAACAEPGDAVLMVSGDRYPLFLYYYQRQFPNDDGPVVYLLPRHSTQFTADSVEGELAPLAEEHPRLWLASFERALQDPENVVEPWLEAHRTPALTVVQGYNYLRLYAGREDAPKVKPAFQPQHPVAGGPVAGMLLGHDLPTSEFRPGDSVNLGLYVRAAKGGEHPVDLVVEWVAPDGHVVDRREVAAPTMPQDSGTVRLMAPFEVYSYTVPGPYSFDVYPAGNGANRVRFAAGRVTHSQRLPRAKIDQPGDVSVGDGLIRFLGYRMRPSERVRPGGQVTVDLLWQAQRRPDTDYTVFVHLLGGYNPATGGPVWAQDDSYPLDGGHPTTRWLPGQIVTDRHILDLPDGIPPGIYPVEVGLYSAVTGERLSVADSEQDRILIGEIQIVQ
jgi:4-amino-4-deoxy-L-arabinose transferase-like glycosyltransferase